MHEKVHESGAECRSECKIVRGLQIRSLELGIAGVADAVEFYHSDFLSPVHNKCAFAKNEQPYPVEYKRGKPKILDCDRIQLCAQAMCIEEMLGLSVPVGAIYYGKPHRREEVELTAELRFKTSQAAKRLHELVKSFKTPAGKYTKQCERCSLLELCMPQSAGKNKSAVQYVERMCFEETA